MQVSSLAVHTSSAATTSPQRHHQSTLFNDPGAHHEDFLSSGAALASKTAARPDLPGVCADRRAVPGLAGKQGEAELSGRSPEGADGSPCLWVEWNWWDCGDSKECTTTLWSWEQKPAVLWSVSKCGKVTFLLLKLGWWSETLSNDLDMLLSVLHFHLEQLWNHCNRCLKASALHGLAFLYFCIFDVQKHATVTVYGVWGEAALC